MEKYTKYEKARIIGARALQISMGAPFLMKMGKEDLEAVQYNPIRIAEKEYNKGILPMTIKRPLPDTRKKSEFDDEEEPEEEEDKESEEKEDEE